LPIRIDTLVKEEVGSSVKPIQCHTHNWLRDETKIFVGNLSGETTEDDLRQAFETFGEVKSVTIVMDAGEGKSRRSGFVTMPSVNEAQNAIRKMDGRDLGGQKISVEKSRTNAKARAIRRKRAVNDSHCQIITWT
jgi:RNA recognition motif-containing protein